MKKTRRGVSRKKLVLKDVKAFLDRPNSEAGFNAKVRQEKEPEIGEPKEPE